MNGGRCADGALMTRSQAAAALGVHPLTVVSLDNQGRLRAALRTSGGARRWRAEDVAAFKAARDAREPSLPDLCLDVLRSLGGEATSVQVRRVLGALGIPAPQHQVNKSLDRLVTRAVPEAGRVEGSCPQRWRLLAGADEAAGVERGMAA